MEFSSRARLFSETMTTIADDSLSLEEYLTLPNDDLYIDEVSQGRLVREPRPGQQHGMIVSELTYLLRSFLEESQLGVVITEGGFILNRSPLTVRGPDVAFVRNERLQPTVSFFEGAPDIAIEVVSPSNRPGELLQKVGEFLVAETQIVWVVYPDTKTIVEHTVAGDLRILNIDDVLDAPALLPGFAVALKRIFR
jgi:Uma2 family endonuclease